LCLTDDKVVCISKTHRDDKCKKKKLRITNTESIYYLKTLVKYVFLVLDYILRAIKKRENMKG